MNFAGRRLRPRIQAIRRLNAITSVFTALQFEWPIELYRKGYAKHITIMAGNTADDQNVMVIAGHGDIHIEKDLLADQYKAVLPLTSYYQFMDKYFTPCYLLDIVAERE